MEYKATIISVADSTHYLVGTTDSNESFVKLPQLSEVVECRSLMAAKEVLRGLNISVAKLTLKSAYDEMCGLPASGDFHETIYLK